MSIEYAPIIKGMDPLITVTIVEIMGVAIISFVIGFAIGFLVGWISPTTDKTNIQLWIAVFITIIWAVSVIATIAVPSYETSIWVHGIMGGISGYLFGVENPILGGNIYGK